MPVPKVSVLERVDCTLASLMLLPAATLFKIILVAFSLVVS